jgi:hypothetical protein
VIQVIQELQCQIVPNMRYSKNTFLDAVVRKSKILKKYLKNTENSGDSDHTGTTMPNSAKHEIFQKYLFGHSCEKIENSEKMLKNTENSGDSGHTRTTMPNSAKYEIFQKY